MAGSLGKLYQSVANLSDDYMQTDKLKDMVLKPKPSPSPILSQVPLLPPQEWASPTSATNFYYCGRCSATATNDLLSKSARICPYCSTTMSNYVTHHVPTTYAAPATPSSTATVGGGFVKGLVTYMVMDDLVVAPMSTISSITLLNKFNIKDISALEEKVVHIGMDEGLELLKHAWGSKTVLTNVFLATKYENVNEV